MPPLRPDKLDASSLLVVGEAEDVARDVFETGILDDAKVGEEDVTRDVVEEFEAVILDEAEVVLFSVVDGQRVKVLLAVDAIYSEVACFVYSLKVTLKTSRSMEKKAY